MGITLVRDDCEGGVWTEGSREALLMVSKDIVILGLILYLLS